MSNSNEEDPSQTRLLKIGEVAHLLRVCRAQVYHLIATRGLPVIQLGGSKRVLRAALSQWIEEQTSKKNQHEGGSGTAKEDNSGRTRS